MGDIVQFPAKEPPKKTCDHCVNASFSTFGIFCLEFREYINDEEIADECEAFEPQPTSMFNHPSFGSVTDG